MISLDNKREVNMVDKELAIEFEEPVNIDLDKL